MQHPKSNTCRAVEACCGVSIDRTGAAPAVSTAFAYEVSRDATSSLNLSCALPVVFVAAAAVERSLSLHPFVVSFADVQSAVDSSGLRPLSRIKDRCWVPTSCSSAVVKGNYSGYAATLYWRHHLQPWRRGPALAGDPFSERPSSLMSVLLCVALQ